MFVVRSTRDGEEIVVLRYAAAYYWLMWPTIALSIWSSTSSSTPVNIATGIAWLFLFAAAIPYWPIVVELKRRMREGSITMSGSKYSFSNPLTYRWVKADPG
jgi:hypothetical protein